MKVFFPHSVYRLKNFYNIRMFSWRSKDSCPGLFSYDSTWRYSAYSAPSSNLRDVCGDDAMSQENGVSQNELGYFHLKAVSPQIFEKPLSYAWVCLCQRCFWISMIRDLTIWLKANTSFFFFFFSQWNPFSQSIWPIKPLQFYYPPPKKKKIPPICGMLPVLLIYIFPNPWIQGYKEWWCSLGYLSGQLWYQQDTAPAKVLWEVKFTILNRVPVSLCAQCLSPWT